MYFSSIVYIINVMTYCFSGPIFTQTSRGARVIIFEGYKFIKHRGHGLKVRWYCTQHGYGCRAAMFTVENKVVSVKKEHNHPPPENLLL